MKNSMRTLRYGGVVASLFVCAGCSSDSVFATSTKVVTALSDAGDSLGDAAVTTQSVLAEAGGLAAASDGNGPADDGTVSTVDADATFADGESTDDASTVSGVQIGPSSSTQALIRIANWVPDSPATGYDMCLEPSGTTSWIGPLLAMNFAAGALGEGGPNGIQFPYVTAYVGIPPGQYDLQLVAPGTGCSMGVIGTTYGLPLLTAGSITTFAATGTVNQIDIDSPLKISAFSDETAGNGAGALVRFVNADPTVAAAVAGMGDLAQGNFAPLFQDAAFGVAARTLADGGTSDANGYTLIAPLASQLLSAHATGGTTDLATVAHANAAAGTVTTLVLINGADEGTPTVPPQLMGCVDSAPPEGALSQCTVLIPE